MSLIKPTNPNMNRIMKILQPLLIDTLKKGHETMTLTTHHHNNIRKLKLERNIQNKLFVSCHLMRPCYTHTFHDARISIE